MSSRHFYKQNKKYNYTIRVLMVIAKEWTNVIDYFYYKNIWQQR